MRIPVLLCVLVALLAAAACAPSRYVRPLEKGQIAVDGSFGGPVIGFGSLTIPIPLTNVGVGYGIHEKVTVHSHLHTTSLLYGTLQLDAGATATLLPAKGRIPGVSLSPSLQFGMAFSDGRAKLWPAFEANTWWEYSEKKPHYLYAGLGTWLEPSALRAHDDNQPNLLLPFFQLGHVFSRTEWDYILEAKYIGFNRPRQDLVVDYKGIGQQGAFGLYFGLAKKF